MTKSIIQIGFNPATAKLYNADDAAKVIVSTALSYFVDGYEYSETFKSHNWDGRSTFFNWNSATFPRGFVDEVEVALLSKGYTVQRVCRPNPIPLGDVIPKVDDFGESERYDYQMETVNILLKRGVMIARVATGGGKSRIAKLATRRIGRKTLFVTARKPLMYQMSRSYEASGFDVGLMGDGEWDKGHEVTCAMVQTLISRLKEPEPGDKSGAAMRQERIRRQTIAMLEEVEFIIGEEAHEAGGASYYELLKYCKKAHYRLGLTATPFMRDSEESNMRLKGAFGAIGIDVSEKKLIDRNILAKPYFKFIDSRAPARLTKSTPYHRAVELGIIDNEFRNTEIVRECLQSTNYGLTTMVLVIRKQHGENLLAMCIAAGLRAEYIYGDKDQDVRDKAMSRLEAGKIDVLIGTNILDVGVDIPAVGKVILAGGGKAEVAHRQRIGRGLREKKKGPNVCFIVDFEDTKNGNLRKHAYARRQIIEQTPGFSDNVLSVNDDFTYEELGFIRK